MQTRQSMNIIMLAETFQPAYVREIANAMRRRGFGVALIGCSEHAGLSYEPGVQVVDLRGDVSSRRSSVAKIAGILAYYVRTLGFLLRRPERVIYEIGIGKPFLTCVLLNAILKALGRTVVYTVHNLLPHGSFTWASRRLHWIIYRLTTDYLVAHTQDIGEKLVREFGVPPAKVTVVHHGIYQLPGEPGSRAPARRRLGFAEEEFLLLVFGHQRPYKGTHFLLEAVGRRGYRHARIIIRGQARGDYGERLRELIDRYGLQEAVDCSLGYVEEQEMRLAFEAADVVVLPYFEGSQSGVMFMAFAFGRPALASDLPGLSSAIVAGRNGETFRAGDEEALVEAIESMRVNRGRYDERFIRRYAREHFSWDSCAAALSSRIFARIESPGTAAA